jgi:sulfate adenylyltransferase subunit 1 (EFTu-like GTPase family)
MSERPLQIGGKYLLLHTTNFVRAMVTDVLYKVDVNTLSRSETDKTVQMNDIGKISVKTTKPIFFDPYRRNRSTGSFILIDEATNATVAAGMIS